MSIVFLFLCPALFALYWIIRVQVCSSRLRRLVDAYGIDPKKLKKMSCKEVARLKKLIDQANDKGDMRGLEFIIKPLRP